MWVPAHRRQAILGLGLPIIGGMVSQNVLNLIDTAMVGTLGDAALAATGMGSFANFLAQAPLLGLGAGVQAMVSRRKGEGKDSETAIPLNGGLQLALLIGLCLSALAFVAVPYVFPYLNSDPAVIEQGVPYLQARVCAIVALGCNVAFRGFWNGINMSRLYLFTLVFMHSTNVLLNYTLIFGNFGAPALGTLGAGMGTSISLFLGTACYVVMGFRLARTRGFMRERPSYHTLGTILRISVPTSIQMFFFAGGFTAMLWIIGRVGTSELAAANVLLNVTLLAILPGLGLGLAAASFVGQALGRGDVRDAKRWGWDVVKVGLLVMGLIGLPMWTVPDVILSGFLHDPQTLELARWPLRIIGLTIAFESLTTVLMNALQGAGDSPTAMRVSIIAQWGVFLPAAYVIGPVLGGGLLVIWIAHVGYRLLQGLVFGIMWQREGWGKIKV